MTTVIKNATIVTGNNGRTVLYDSAIAIDGDRIVAIGPTPEVTAAHPAAEQIEGSGKAVFPGLVNCHTHLLATNDRGILEDLGFPTTLKFPASARSMLSQEERQVMATLGVLEAIRSGTTCLLEVQAEVADYAEHLEKTGMRMVLADSVNDVDESAGPSGSSSARMDQGLQRCADLIDGWHGKGDGRISCFVAPHAPETVSPDLLRRSREMAESYDVGYTIHLSQSPNEIESVMRARGVPPTHYLFANDFLGPRLVLAHCRYVNSAEVALLGQAGCGVSNNAAIAARAAQARGVRRIAILDVDYHHGNGTQDIFYDDGEVLFASIHADPKTDFPFYWGHADERGRGQGEGATLNLPLPQGTDWAGYAPALDTALDAVRAHGADLLIVSYGADTFAEDPISHFRLVREDYGRMGKEIAALDLPTLVVMEGGYAVDALGGNLAAFVGAL